MSDDIKVSTIGSRLTVKKAKRLGADVDRLLEEVGLTLNVINNEDGLIPHERYARLVELAANDVGDPYFGLHLSEQYDLLDLGAIGYIGLASETLEDAILNLQRYLHTVTQAWTLELEVADDDAIVTFIPNAPEMQSYRHVIEATGASLMVSYQQVLGHPLKPKVFQFAHKFDGDPTEHERVLACPVEFGHNRNRLIIDRKDLQLPIPTADDRLLKVLTKNMKQVQEKQAKKASKLVAKIEDAAMPLIPKGKATASIIAQEIGMSERSMQRHLADQGKRFATIVDEIKEQLAMKYLKEEDLSLIQIAFLLGYADQSGFTTAFKKWTGTTPRQAKLKQFA